MRREEILELHNIQHVENIASVLEHGLLCHQSARNHPHRSVAAEEIQQRRAKVTVPGGRPLHHYANLYINARNPMMYRVIGDHGTQDICVLRFSTDVLDLPDVVITDKNASSDYVRWARPSDGIPRLDREELFAQYWTHAGDPIAEYRHKSAMCAEVLVPERVAPSFIAGIYVPDSAVSERVQLVTRGLAVEINRYLFFR